VGGNKAVDKATISFSGFGQREKATISSSGSGPRAGYSCTDPVKWYVYSYQYYHDEWIFIRLTYS